MQNLKYGLMDMHRFCTIIKLKNQKLGMVCTIVLQVVTVEKLGKEHRRYLCIILTTVCKSTMISNKKLNLKTIILAWS